ncbi:MAG: FHA domain-containing protein [candidate division KSB1 bacterium]|nr:FHA domain-containing protein [candidate division KSB1 bacterium]MDZ7301173.1 FHA domain-containing protein [candidate division KSB1 bacterium]MDZ7310603.1 FHA domain-containing protein [candidate division KSB1 bacterium]
MPIVQITKDGILLHEIEIHAEQVTIGRDPENDIRLADLTVSRLHGRLTRQTGGRYYIEDLNSRNGIRVNGHVITQPLALTDGDRVQVGVYQLIFLDPVEVTRLNQEQISTTTELMLRETSGSAPARVGSPQGRGHESAAAPSAEEKSESGEFAPGIGILVNEANNAIFTIDRDHIVLGSEGQVDIRVPGPKQIRATIARRGKHFYICSETPLPCVSVNGRPVMNSQLVYNDRIEIGERRFIFREI